MAAYPDAQQADGRHEDPSILRQKLGRSIWLLLLLRDWTPHLTSDVRSGDSIRAIELATALGVGERQVRRDLRRLRHAGLIETENTGRGFKIRVVHPVAG